MFSINKFKDFLDRALEEERLYYDEVHKEDLVTLELLDLEIVEEEAKLKLNEEQLKSKNTHLKIAEEASQKEIQDIQTELKAISHRKKELREQLKQAQCHYRLYGPSFASYLKVNYAEVPGKVLCPEGKVCASIHEEDEVCNYWECPALVSIRTNPLTISVNGSKSKSMMTTKNGNSTQLDSMTMTTTSSSYAFPGSSDVTVIHNGTNGSSDVTVIHNETNGSNGTLTAIAE